MSKNEPLRVLVAGGGIGGLALVQGLRQAGVLVSVHEKTKTRTDPVQGFRVHISPFGAAALQDCLPAHLFDAFLASAGQGGNGFTFATEQLRQLLTVEPELRDRGSSQPTDNHYGISRITLRQILLAGLDEDVVHFDKALRRYERNPDGTVTAYFADGSSETGDVLVGADGGSSKVRGQYLPEAGRIDTGIVGIAGKYLLTEQNRAQLDPMLLRTPMTVMPPKDYGMFCAPHELDAPTDLLAEGIGGNAGSGGNVHLDNTRSYAFWAFAAHRDAFDPALGKLDALDGATLRELVLDKIGGWSPALRFLVAESSADTVNAIPILSATPMPPWPTTNVTLLGDAIHSMTPFRGIGANTALRDAQLLSRQLIAADRGESPALGGHQRLRDPRWSTTASPPCARHCAPQNSSSAADGRAGWWPGPSCAPSAPSRRSNERSSPVKAQVSAYCAGPHRFRGVEPRPCVTALERGLMRKRTTILAALPIAAALTASLLVSTDSAASSTGSGGLAWQPVAEGSGGAVVSDTLQSTQAGLDVLRRGGTAADAAVAVASTLGVTDPFVAGIGGGGYLVYYDARTHKITTIDGRETTPAAANQNLFIDPATGKPFAFPTAVTSGLSVGVPGTLMTWQRALNQWGHFSLAQDLRPAEQVAQDGFPATAHYSEQIRENAGRFTQFSSSSALYLDNGQQPPVGSTIRNPGLAATYRQIGRQGVGALYGGEHRRRRRERGAQPAARARRHPRAPSRYHATVRSGRATRRPTAADARELPRATTSTAWARPPAAASPSANR